MPRSERGKAMPIHDWTRVTPNTGHAFHLSWIGQLQTALNSGLLPDDYYCLGEQVTGRIGPDVLTLKEADAAPSLDPDEADGGLVVTTAPPKTKQTAEVEIETYARKRR